MSTWDADAEERIHRAAYADARARLMIELEGDDPDYEAILAGDEDAIRRRIEAEIPELAYQARILDAFADAIDAAGLTGERRLVRLLFLVVFTRHLDRPVSVAIKGPSSAGKSFVIERVLAYVPAGAYYALSSMSEHALIYDREPLQHRMLVLYEAAGLASDLATYMVRSLLSEGHVRYVTVEKVKGGGLQPRTIDREGPTGLIVTTTEIKLHPENETRLLSLTVTDTPEQTRAILLAQAGELPEPDVAPWHALADWVAGQPTAVAVPFAADLAALIPPVAVRLRRDFPAVLSLIRAHALLHQARRQRDADGRLLATLDDYAAVRELVADLVAEAAEQTVPQTVRETVAVVAVLVATTGTHTTVTAVAATLKLDKSAALRRVRVAIDRGYLRNLEDKRGRPARIVLGDALPQEVTVLPTVEGLQGCTPLEGDTYQAPPDAAVEPEIEGLQPRRGVSLSIPGNGTATVQPSGNGAAPSFTSRLDALQAALGWPPREGDA